MKCRLCGKEFEKRNAMHCHLIRVHEAEYRAAKLNLDRLVENPTPRQQEQPDVKARRQANLLPKPDGFRLLRRNDPTELNAINAGYTYTDGENVFTTDDAKAEQWI